MRPHAFLASLILAAATPALARGGPSGMLGTILEGFTFWAIAAGLFAGLAWSRSGRHLPARSLLVLSAVTLGFSWQFVLAGLLLGIPAGVALAVFSAAAYLKAGGLLRPRPEPSGQNPAGRRGRLTLVLRWLSASYLFWAVIACFNIKLLGFLAFPPTLLLDHGTITRFFPFILPPLGLALAITSLGTGLLAALQPRLRHAAPVIFNVGLLIAFLVCADLQRERLMRQALRNHPGIELDSASFLRSVLAHSDFGRSAHASFSENGKFYHWSYAAQDFVTAP
ncbi:hypothetical protein [Chitinimonas sp.]|uniref:hypothetical protein n=1 Tax=Chitinimonas sp. TaxID=1934313 RepID=UPI0035B19860